MIEDGVYYEFYGNYEALFWGWLTVYALLILLPVFVFGRKRLSRLSLKKQLSVGIPTMTVLVALPFALVAESYFAYQEFMRLCRTEAALKIYQPIPEYSQGYAVDLGNDVSLSELASCGERCEAALISTGYVFFEQISMETAEGRNALRAIIRPNSGGYEYIPYPDEPIMRVYRFNLMDADAGTCPQRSADQVGSSVRRVARGDTFYCIVGYQAEKAWSMHMLESEKLRPQQCCITQRVFRSRLVSTGETVAEYSRLGQSVARYLYPFLKIWSPYGWTGMSNRCISNPERVNGITMPIWLIGRPQDRAS